MTYVKENERIGQNCMQKYNCIMLLGKIHTEKLINLNEDFLKNHKLIWKCGKLNTERENEKPRETRTKNDRFFCPQQRGCLHEDEKDPACQSNVFREMNGNCIHTGRA